MAGTASKTATACSAAVTSRFAVVEIAGTRAAQLACTATSRISVTAGRATLALIATTTAA